MNGRQISAFVDSLEAGDAKIADFHKLSPSDWEEVRKLLEARRQYNMQEYINALFIRRMKCDLERANPERIYTEAEILNEFDRRK